MIHTAYRRSRVARHGLVLTLTAALLASCSATSERPSSGSTSPQSAPAPASTTDDAATDDTATDDTATAAPSTTVMPVPPANLPAVPDPFALIGSPAEQATAIATALADPATDRSAVALAAFEAAGVPLLLADGTSLTSTPDPIGLPWSVVASAAALSGPKSRVSLTELTRLFSMVDPTLPFDAAVAADATAAALRAELAAPTAPGPSFVAQLVAAESRLFDGTELADPAVTASQLHVSTTTALVIGAGVIRATAAELIEADMFSPAPTETQPAGLRRATTEVSSAQLVHRPAQSGLSNGCDDGVGGWGLWVGSKIATGAALAPQFGVEWKGIYVGIATLAAEHGINTQVLDAAKGFTSATAVVFAVVNVAIFLAQVTSRNATATMDGEGPLVRTKTTYDHGSARHITLTISYDDGGDPEIINQRNCMLAAMMLIGNNAQLAKGPASDVIVATSGATGFANGLAAGDSYVLFGPERFQIEQTADANGRIVVPVQGRRQKVDRSDATTKVDKEFGVFFEATLDPSGASQIARAFADDMLCIASIGTAQVGPAIAECQNALIDIIKQFRWDIGEFMFPLQDWANGGWNVTGRIEPYDITGIKCDGIDGLWILNFIGDLEGGVADGVIEGQMDGDTGTGTFVLDGIASGGGISIPIQGSGTMTFVQTGEDTAQLILEGTIENGGLGGGTLELTRSSCE